MVARFRACLTAVALLAAVSPAAAQWQRVSAVPITDIFSVWANGDTIVAGADTAVFVSANAGASWKRSAKVAAGVTSIQAVRVRNGRLYAGTFGQGVFVSDDLGDSWQAFNQGLVGGFLDSQLDLSDFQVLDDGLYAATLGAGVYARSLTPGGTWSHFGEAFEPNQASNVNALVLGGTRLLAAAGGNGAVFVRDPGDGDWTVSNLDNIGLHPGMQAQSAAWTGAGWVVGTNLGLFHSVLGQEPWTRVDPGLGPLNQTSFATRGRRLFGAFDIVNAAVIETSGDDGVSWQVMESLPNVFVYKVAMSTIDLYAGRADGLWRRSTATVSVPGNDAPTSLRFALAGPQPVGDGVRFRFDLPAPGNASIEVFDVAGRRAAGRIQRSLPAGSHEVSWDARGLEPGVYQARLTVEGRHEVLRLVHVR